MNARLDLPPLDPYIFPAMFIVTNSDGTWYRDSVPLTFHRADDGLKPWLADVWKNMQSAVRKCHELHSQEIPKWLNWQPSQLCYEKTPIQEGRTPVLIMADEHIAGFLNLWRTQDAQPVVYIEHICLSPGSMQSMLWQRRYLNLGYSLMAYAMHLSRENGMNGRVGLHAMDDHVLNSVYRKYAERVPGLFKPDKKDIPGPTSYGPKKNLSLTYLETTEAGAETFLEAFRYG